MQRLPGCSQTLKHQRTTHAHISPIKNRLTRLHTHTQAHFQKLSLQSTQPLISLNLACSRPEREQSVRTTCLATGDCKPVPTTSRPAKTGAQRLCGAGGSSEPLAPHGIHPRVQRPAQDDLKHRRQLRPAVCVTSAPSTAGRPVEAASHEAGGSVRAGEGAHLNKSTNKETAGVSEGLVRS